MLLWLSLFDCFLFICLFCDRVSVCNPGCPETHYKIWAGLKLTIKSGLALQVGPFPATVSRVRVKIVSYHTQMTLYFYCCLMEVGVFIKLLITGELMFGCKKQNWAGDGAQLAESFSGFQSQHCIKQHGGAGL